MKELNNIYNLMKSWIISRCTGSIKINFMKGGITNVNISKSLLPKDIDINKA